MQVVFAACACISIIAIFLICIFLFANGLPGMAKIGFGKFLGGTIWRPANNLYGILPMIVASIEVTIGALIIGIVIGVLTAIFLAFFCPKKLYAVLKPGINLLAGIPSVVYGFFGLMVVVPMIRNTAGGAGLSMLAACIILGIMILPTIITMSETALRAVPTSYYEGSLGLGATHERSIFRVVVPAAKSGIFAGIILGVGRAIGETMAVIMIAGNQAVMPHSLFAGVRTMTANIVLEMGYATDLHRQALIATAVVLFVFILIINIGFSILKNKGDNH
ncbi:MAG: phosphate ABC transporter permease subunit PstC [Pseudoramibacter sp.]